MTVRNAKSEKEAEREREGEIGRHCVRSREEAEKESDTPRLDTKIQLSKFTERDKLENT